MLEFMCGKISGRHFDKMHLSYKFQFQLIYLLISCAQLCTLHIIVTKPWTIEHSSLPLKKLTWPTLQIPWNQKICHCERIQHKRILAEAEKGTIKILQPRPSNSKIQTIYTFLQISRLTNHQVFRKHLRTLALQTFDQSCCIDVSTYCAFILVGNLKAGAPVLSNT